VLKGNKSTYKSQWTLTSKKLIYILIFILNISSLD